MLKEKIGSDAGLIWNALESKKEMNVKEVKKITKLNEKDMNLALGWLAREGKICFSQNEAEIFVCLD